MTDPSSRLDQQGSDIQGHDLQGSDTHGSGSQSGVLPPPPPPPAESVPPNPGYSPPPPNQTGYVQPPSAFAAPGYGQTGPAGPTNGPAGLPNGYAPPYGAQAGPARSNPGVNRPSMDPAALMAGAKRFSGSSTLMLIVAAVCHVLGLVVPSGGNFPFFDLGLWAVFGIVSVALLGAPLVAGALKLSAVQAWRIAGAGCIGLAFHWLAFVVPILEKNPSFFMTVGFGAALWSTYLAPGRVEALAKTP